MYRLYKFGNNWTAKLIPMERNARVDERGHRFLEFHDFSNG